MPDDNIINTSYLLTFIAAGKDVGKRNYFSLYGNRDEIKSRQECKTKFLGLMIFSQTVLHHTRESLNDIVKCRTFDLEPSLRPPGLKEFNNI